MSGITSGTVVSVFKQTHFYSEKEIKEFQRKKSLEIKRQNNKLTKQKPVEAVNDRQR